MGIGRASGVPEPESEQPGAGWSALALRGACLTLARSAPGAVSRTSVSGPRPAAPDGERWLRDLAARLAGEYGLQVRIDPSDHGLSIIFMRTVREA